MKKITLTTLVLIFISSSDLFAQDKPLITISVSTCDNKIKPNTLNCPPPIPISLPESLKAGGRPMSSGPKVECGPDGPCPKAVKMLIEQNKFRFLIMEHSLFLAIKNNLTDKEIFMKLGLSEKAEFELIERIKADRETIFTEFIDKQSPENTKNVATILLQDVTFIFIHK